MLAAVVVLVVFIVWGYRRSGDKGRHVLRLTLGIAVMAMEVLREAGYLFTGNYQPPIVPLHLCAIGTFCVFIDSLRPNTWTREYIYALGTWGPVCAIAFPDWAAQPWFNIYTWQGFLIHGCLAAYALMILVSRDFRPTARHLWKAVVIMAVAIGLSLIANHAWGTNFWFLNTGSPGSPLEPIQNLTGPFYIPVLIVLLAIIWTAMYLPWRKKTSAPVAVVG